MNNCADCRHYFRENGASECRRYPPIGILVPRPNRMTGVVDAVPAGMFPPVAPNFSCGEHEPVAMLETGL